MRTTQALLPLLLSLLLTSCASLPDAGDPRPPDEILWNRATRRIDQQRCDVARLTMQNLINTYPDSKYALDAEDALRTDPRLQPCHQVGDINGSTVWYIGPPDVTN